MKGFGVIAPFGLRMSQETKEAIKKASEDSKRSMNSEVLERIEESLKKDGYLKEAA